MKSAIPGLLVLLALAPGLAQADGTPPADPFDYSVVAVDHLGIRSDFFADRSSGNGFKLAYDDQDGVYVFGQWNHLRFSDLPASNPGSHNLYGVGIGAHQAYNPDTSFYIDAGFYRDQLSASLGSAADDFWRVNYGFRYRATTAIELDAAIFTERSTDFGRRPFGERLGFGIDLGLIVLQAAG
ncbi:MAG TPA: hypothetical protein VFV77_04150 [Gammaproteobacteria bacterium]|nr:hypothetical protein [Gammaproteobacteria bacterium]